MIGPNRLSINLDDLIWKEDAQCDYTVITQPIWIFLTVQSPHLFFSHPVHPRESMDGLHVGLELGPLRARDWVKPRKFPEPSPSPERDPERQDSTTRPQPTILSFPFLSFIIIVLSLWTIGWHTTKRESSSVIKTNLHDRIGVAISPIVYFP